MGPKHRSNPEAVYLDWAKILAIVRHRIWIPQKVRAIDLGLDCIIGTYN